MSLSDSGPGTGRRASKQQKEHETLEIGLFSRFLQAVPGHLERKRVAETQSTEGEASRTMSQASTETGGLR